MRIKKIKSYQKIRDLDIKKVKELYGEKGFQAFTGDDSFNLV